MPLISLNAGIGVVGAVLAAAAPGDVTTGTVGFLVIAGIGVALFFLVRSMNKQIRRIDVDQNRDNKDESDEEDRHTSE